MVADAAAPWVAWLSASIWHNLFDTQFCVFQEGFKLVALGNDRKCKYILMLLKNNSACRGLIIQAQELIGKGVVHPESVSSWWRHQMETLPRYWPVVRVDSPHKDQWRGALMFSLICVWTNRWANHRDAGGLKRHRTHYDVTVMFRLDSDIFIGSLVCN